MSKKTRKKSATTKAAKTTAKPARKAAKAKTGRAAATKKPAAAKAAKAPARAARPPAKATTKPAAKPAAKAAPKPSKTTSRAAAKPAAKPTTKAVEKTKAIAARTPAAAGEALAAGAAAPAFTLPRDGGGEVSLSDFAGRKLVVFFYPRASTPGCTKEAMDFTRLKSDFAAAGADILGVSADSVKAQDSFRDKYSLDVPLASDQQQQMLSAYGAWGEKSMYGKSFMGIIRTTVLIDAKGRVARVWRHVKVDGHAEEVLEAARSI
jgi:peroxiredoxin Q/BCP